MNYVDLNYIDVQGENYSQNFDELLKALGVGFPASTLPASQAGKPSFRWNAQSIALIGGGVLLTAVLLGSFLMRDLFVPEPAPSERTADTEAVIVLTLTSPPSSATPAPAVMPTVTPLPSEITDAQGMNMILVPEGKFSMGSNIGDSNEQPVQEVELDTFYMDHYEVTHSAYKACVDAGKCTSPGLNALGGFLTNYYDDPQYAEYPVVYVNWFQARSYCEWRGAQLPTEAQWEKAARGTDGPTYPWGPYITCDRANYNYCIGLTSAVGSFSQGASPYGVYDLAGNVWEWTADWYSDTYYQTSPFPPNPTGPADGQFRVLRGGSFVDDENSQRSSHRQGELPENFNWNIGFRCARDVDS